MSRNVLVKLNPEYRDAPYELSVRDAEGGYVSIPYPYRYARAEDCDPKDPKKNTIPPFIEEPIP